MYRFMVSYVEQVMTTMAADNSTWTYDAVDFLDVLYSGQLPPISVSPQLGRAFLWY